MNKMCEHLAAANPDSESNLQTSTWKNHLAMLNHSELRFTLHPCARLFLNASIASIAFDSSHQPTKQTQKSNSSFRLSRQEHKHQVKLRGRLPVRLHQSCSSESVSVFSRGNQSTRVSNQKQRTDRICACLQPHDLQTAWAEPLAVVSKWSK